MKKIMFMMISAVLMIGCSSMDSTYGISKTIYGASKAAVNANANMIGEKTMKQLKRVDKVAKTYDAARTSVRGK